MNQNARKSAFVVALSTLGCGLILSSAAIAKDTKVNSTAVDAADAPSVPDVGSPSSVAVVTSSGDEGGIAGSVVWDNGPLITTVGGAGTCVPPADLSTLQNVSLGLNTLGFGAQGGAINNVMADDFTLATCTDLSTIEFYMYQTGATTTTITGVSLALHSAQPLNPLDAVIQTATGGTITLAGINRSAETLDCSRDIQKISVDVSSWPDLAAGTYWISWNATGTLASGPWQPSVSILTQCGATGANAMQALAGGAFAPAVDTGGGPGCEGAPQDMPFVLRGTACGGNPCPADIGSAGGPTTPDGTVDINDLLSVNSVYGQSGAPGFIPQDVSGPTQGVPDGVIDINDLLFVIGNWGACP